MIEKMPSEYKGKTSAKTNYTSTDPREWTEKEVEWLKQKKSEGYSRGEIAYSMDRSETSVAIKLKRLKKSEDTYNEKHLDEKYEINDLFLEEIQPKSILDCFCGVKSFYKSKENVTTNDIDPNIESDYHLDAFKFLCQLYSQDNKYDLIDLDPFGSAFDCFDLAVKMAKKGLIITFGELGHKRFKRLDFVSRYYGITELEAFTLETLIDYVQKIGQRNKKNLVVRFKKEWQISVEFGSLWSQSKFYRPK